LARGDSNEPPWFRLGAWSDSAEVRAFLATRGQPAEAATITIDEGGDGGSFSFEARLPDGSLLAAGSFASPGVPVPTVAPSVPTVQRGRLLSVDDGHVAALDWDKTESTCLAGSVLRWDATSPLFGLLGPASTAAFSFVVDVAEGRYTFRRLG
jgi:hypothetical protein